MKTSVAKSGPRGGYASARKSRAQRIAGSSRSSHRVSLAPTGRHLVLTVPVQGCDAADARRVACLRSGPAPGPAASGGPTGPPTPAPQLGGLPPSQLQRAVAGLASSRVRAPSSLRASRSSWPASGWGWITEMSWWSMSTAVRSDYFDVQLIGLSERDRCTQPLAQTTLTPGRIRSGSYSPYYGVITVARATCPSRSRKSLSHRGAGRNRTDE